MFVDGSVPVDFTANPPTNPPAITNKPKYFIYPSYKVSHFVERNGPLEQISHDLQALGHPSTPKVFVLLGMGGCGKSQLALEYCQQAEHNGTYSIIFWIDATSPSTAQQSFTTAAQAILKPEFNAADEEGNLQYIRNTLSTWQGRWLLVFDNFDEPSSFQSKSVKEYFPQGSQGSILVTSRHAQATRLGNYIEVSTMSEDEALELLFQRSEAYRTMESLKEGEKIVKRLGLHALAIDQAGAYILSRHLDVNIYLTHYNDRRDKVLTEVPDLWDYQRTLKETPEAATKLTVFTTWELSFDLITGDDAMRKDKEHILTLIAFFDGKEISDTLFRPYGNKGSNWMTTCVKNNAWNMYEFQDILRELQNLSLLQSLQIHSQGASFSVHPLIQDWIKLRISLDSRRSCVVEAILVLAEFLKCNRAVRMAFDIRQTTLAHLDTVLSNEKEYLGGDCYLTDSSILEGMDWFASFFTEEGRYSAAEQLHRRAFERRKALLGDEHPDTLWSMGALGGILIDRGDFGEAEPILHKTIAMTGKLLGMEHRDTLTAMNDLASLFKRNGKPLEAEQLYRQTLEIKERVFGQEHPTTMKSMNNLALILDRLGKTAEAESLYRQTLALSERLQGKDHPHTLTIMNNLALLLDRQLKYNVAEPMYRQTLALREKVSGSEHPDTLQVVNNLASCLADQNNLAEAEVLFRRAVGGREMVFGLSHYKTRRSLKCLAKLLDKMGRSEEAGETWKRVNSIP
jgi:tetratricopeptide (TPR) repeat protein